MQRQSRIEPLADGGAVRANLDPDAEGDGDRLRSFGELWRENTLFRLLFVAACCSGLLGPMLYFQFSYVANLATEGEQGLLAFYAQIRGWIGVGILATQLGLTSRLYRRIGVPLASLLSPSMYLLGFFGLSVRLSLPAGVGAMAGTKLQDHAIYDPAQRILFNLFPEAIRVRATALLEGPVKRSGGAVGNIVVLGAIGLGGAVWVGYMALPIALAWIAAIAVLWRGYPRLLLQVSAGRARFGETMDLSEMLDVGTMRVLGATLRDEDPVRCAGAIDLVMEARPELSVVALAEAARDAPAATRGQLVAALDRVLEAGVTEPLASPEAARALESLLESAEGLDAQTRADVVQGYGRLTNAAPGEETDRGVLESAVGAPEPAVRLAAAAALHRHGAPPASVPDLDAALVTAVDGDDAAAPRTETAEVGKPGRTTTGRRPLAARQMGLPGLSATPCTTMPGSSSETTRALRSPSPFEVPPDRSTRSEARRASPRAARRAPSSSRKAPRKRGSPPTSVTASARMRPLLS